MIDSPDYQTAVALHYLEGRRNYRLLFGHPANLATEDHRYGETHDIAYFRPGSIFAVDLWDRNEYGTTRWRVYILKAGTVGEVVDRVPQVRPGAHILLRVEGTKRCKLLMQWLRLVEEEGDPALRPADFYTVRDHMIKGLRPSLLNPYMLNRLQGGKNA